MLWVKSESKAGEKTMLTDALLKEIIRRVVEIARPEKIILFGSAARGNMGPNSDVDLLVVKAGVHRRKLAGKIYMGLTGVGQAVDVVVVTPEDIRRYGSCPALVIEPAIREGRVVYAAQQASSG
jgi:predicted nucleotidyltransferase